MSNFDPFGTRSESVGDPARNPFPITPSDADPLPRVTKAIYVGTGGILVARGAGGAVDVAFRNVASGQVLDIQASHVRATGTTAGDLVGLA